MAEDEIGVIRYAVIPLNFSGTLTLVPYLDGNVVNRDANYDEKFWDVLETGIREETAFLKSRTRKTGFEVCYAMQCSWEMNAVPFPKDVQPVQQPGYIGFGKAVHAASSDEIVLCKYVSVLDSMNYTSGTLVENSLQKARQAAAKQYAALFAEHVLQWEENWSHSDIRIEGDPLAQQGIRFNIFQLNQTYTGHDERLNIGPKGFTGEKYGGSTYWDTEAYMIPFYLSTRPGYVARNLLIYRYRHLGKAIENATKLGFSRGAALYPMVTMNGEECHNEWEITFEEIHRNGAIAFAIYNYIRYTGEKEYIAEYGLEVLIAISRFWQQRVNWSEEKGKYVMLGVTGPNEYENNVNNNWYTNRIAVWTLRYTMESLDYVKREHADRYEQILKKSAFDPESETKAWQDIIQHMHFPVLQDRGIFLQQDGYMDKEQRLAADLSPEERPINQHWSWDRILRSVFIKQADVLQGMFLFEDEFDTDTLRRHFDFYEPRTVHESSLSPCVHAVLANRIGYVDKAYELYLRTSRLDLDDYNKEVAEGLHITSMGGTWMSVVMGFGGMRISNGRISFAPHLPKQWKSLSFNIMFRDRILRVAITDRETTVRLLKGESLQVEIHGEVVNVPST
jgi:maltose phosphorylase